MLKMIKTAALSALIGLGGLAALPAAAQADGIYLNFGGYGNGGYGIQAQFRDHRGHRDYRGDHDWRRDRDRRRGCSLERALDKAERMGIRRARVVDANRRLIEVSGRKFNHRTTVTFANQRGCPVLYR